MIGVVDDELHALLEIRVARDPGAGKQVLQVWIDTAFNGGLVVPREQIESLRLHKASSTDAILANGQIVELETYSCFLDWFGREFRTQVVANDGQFPLLGTTLLAGRMLNIDYGKKTLTVE